MTVSAETRQSISPPPLGWNLASNPRTLPLSGKIRLEPPAHPRVGPKLQIVRGAADHLLGAVAHRLHEGVVDVQEAVVVHACR